MSNLILLTEVLEYVETHIGDGIRTEDIAKACHCSKSTLEKMFRCVNGISVHDYLVRRRMMRAARQLWREPETSLLDIALQYGYSTNESFTRAFRNVWNCNPSEFRGKKRFSELYPKLFVSVFQEDIVFRIGGDEFVMLTDSKDEKYAEVVAEKINARNGEEFTFEGRKIPLHLYVGVTRPEAKNLKYDELFTKLHYVIRDMK